MDKTQDGLRKGHFYLLSLISESHSFLSLTVFLVKLLRLNAGSNPAAVSGARMKYDGLPIRHASACNGAKYVLIRCPPFKKLL